MFKYILSILLIALTPCSAKSASIVDFYKPVIPKDKRESRLLLITGCARSGTMYTARFLQANGLHVEHELDAPDGTVSWIMAVDSPSKHWPCPWGPGPSGFRYKHIFHQVRDPLKSIASLSHEPKKAWDYICAYAPEIKMDDPPLVRAAKCWYYWNLKAEKKAQWTYKVEEMPQVVDKMARKLGVRLNPALLNSVPKDTNSRQYHTTCTWEDLRQILEPALYHKILKLAKHYGYDIDSAPRN